MIKYNTHTLRKLNSLFQDLLYEVRYEKGNFNSGYCIVESQNIIIINKFYDTEGKINALLDILSNISVDTDLLSAPSVKFYKVIKKTAFSDEQ